MNAIKNKIQSSKGASITFALLIFLVCAVVSSVVIVAGTTASGRMSQTAQTDQRFYAVSSAAELLTKAIDGQTVTVAQVTTKTTETGLDGSKTTDTDEEDPLVFVDDISGIDDINVAVTGGTVTPVPTTYSILTEIADILTADADDSSLGGGAATLPKGKKWILSGTVSSSPDGITAEQQASIPGAPALRGHPEDTPDARSFYPEF